MRMNTIQSAVELWQSLQSDASLELKRSADTPGRDIDVELSVKKAIKDEFEIEIGESSLEEWLGSDGGRTTMSVERLLVAVLQSQKDYAFMMKDLLELLVLANARRDRHTLGIEFKFEGVEDPIRYTLEHFRETVRRAQATLSTRYKVPSVDKLWDLCTVLRNATNSPWNLARTVGFPAVASPQKTGHAKLDQVLSEITQIAREYRELCRSVGNTREEVYAKAKDFLGNAPGQDQHVAALLAATPDFPDVSLLTSIENIGDGARGDVHYAAEIASRIDTTLASMPRSRDWVKTAYTELVEQLKLPIWRKRHELFSVWVGSVLLRTARANNESFQFLSADGVLSFAFGGSRLGTYTCDDTQFDIWAELRSPLVGTSAKRTEGIQPDFRVICPSLAAAVGEQTRFVLECKHYLVPSVKNFSDAAQDYAQSCPNAKVMLVNHGPINETATQAPVDPSLQNRIEFLGSITAASEDESNRLSATIALALFPSTANGVPSSMAESLPPSSEALAGRPPESSSALIERSIRQILDLEFGRLRQNDFEKVTEISIEGESSLQDLSALAKLTALESLSLANCDRIHDISAIAKLKKLTHLDLRGCNGVNDLAPLSSLRDLRTLRLAGCRQVVDIAPIWDMSNLVYLDLGECSGITNIEDLARLDSLRALDLSNTIGLTDLRPLKQLQQLDDLDLRGSPASDISALRRLQSLTTLRLDGCQNLRSIEPLYLLTNLTDLSLTECTALVELAGFAHAIELTRFLDLSGCTSLSDLEPIRPLTRLEHLDLSRCTSVRSIAPVSSLANLAKLDLFRCSQITDLSPLTELEELTSLNLSRCTGVSDFSLLASTKSLRVLKLNNCPQLGSVKDLAKIETLNYLSLSGCMNITDLQPLESLSNLTYLDVSGCPAAANVPKGLREREGIEIEYGQWVTARPWPLPQSPFLGDR